MKLTQSRYYKLCVCKLMMSSIKQPATEFLAISLFQNRLRLLPHRNWSVIPSVFQLFSDIYENENEKKSFVWIVSHSSNYTSEFKFKLKLCINYIHDECLVLSMLSDKWCNCYDKSNLKVLVEIYYQSNKFLLEFSNGMWKPTCGLAFSEDRYWSLQLCGRHKSQNTLDTA